MNQVDKVDYGQLYSNPVEKRASPRYSFMAGVEAIDIQANIRMMGRLSDISRHGCYIDTISPFAKDACVTLTITRDKESFSTQANVVYSKIGMGMGMAFTKTDPDELVKLERWLTQLGGETSITRDMPNVVVQPAIPRGADDELRHVLSALIALLNSKKVVGDSEAMPLLRKLSK